MDNSTSGSSNTALGYGALWFNDRGNNNIALGYNAGAQIAGSNNIVVGNAGATSDNGVIRIGDATLQSVTYIAGIENSKVTGSAVFVTPSGQLGVRPPRNVIKRRSLRWAPPANRCSELRPVSFHLKSDPSGPVQYGLIAEEVARVYPELVTRDTHGTPQGVRYDELAPLLLNELQTQQHRNAAFERRLAAQDRRLRQLDQRLASLDAGRSGSHGCGAGARGRGDASGGEYALIAPGCGHRCLPAACWKPAKIACGSDWRGTIREI